MGGVGVYGWGDSETCMGGVTVGRYGWGDSGALWVG